MKKIQLYLLLGVVVFATGCPRYDTVRKLSTEQLRVQQEFQTTMTKYFASMEQFAGNQIDVDKLYYDDLLKTDLKTLQGRFDNAVAKINKDTTTSADDKAAAIKAAAIQFGENQEKKRTQNNQDKAELDSLLIQYKNKNKEILTTYQAILDAQAELDRYIQLKKFDEVITDQLLGKLRVNQQKLTQLFDETAGIADKIKLKPPAPAEPTPTATP